MTDETATNVLCGAYLVALAIGLAIAIVAWVKCA